jgi:glyoxylase-like metal-dependent hydrolase (beta-lactamase superfamily II)
MKIAQNVEMLELSGPQGTLYPVLAWDDQNTVLFDTGLPGQLELIRAAVEKAGISLENITEIILTHHDMDHVGCAKQLKESGPKIMAHEEETPYIQGDAPSPKLLRMEEHLNEMSEEEKTFFFRMKKGAANFYVPVDKRLKDNEIIPYCGGIKVLYTPGHTPGHISLMLMGSNVLITGDAANASEGKMTGPNPEHTLDMPKATESFEKLMRLNPDFVISYHGGLCSL